MVFETKVIEKYRKGRIMSPGPQPSRTYNQSHAPRKSTPGKRRVSIYWTWSYPWEANRDTTELDNRFSTMTEVRRVAWPAYEGTEWDEMHFLQGIAGTLELFHRSTLAFQSVVGDVTGHSVAVFQRIDQAGYKLPIDERILADTRSEEHTSELQSRLHLVCRLLLETKKTTQLSSF